ncbi:MAG: alpha/beta fold hydrolase [Sphingomonas sp.]
MSLEASSAEFLAGARHIQVAGVDTEILVKGQGAPLLFLHGMDGIENASALIDLLARDFTVYAPSHPGFGASALPAHFTHIDDLAYFYLDLLDQLGLDGPVVAGFSFGGWIAAEVLVKDPSRASRLVLGAPLGLPTADRRTQHVTDIFMLGAREVQARMQVAPPPEPVDPAAIPEALLERSVRNAEAVALFGWSPYLHDPKLRHRLRRLAMPTLLLWGEEDRIAPLDYGRGFAAALPGAEFRPLPRCGHRIHIDQPAAAADAIRAFASASAAIEEPAK